MNRTDFGKRVFQEFNFHHWIEIRKGQMFYAYFIMDGEKHPCSFQVLRRYGRVLRSGTEQT